MSTLGKTLTKIAKESRDRALGRIWSMPGNWVFAEDAPAPKTIDDAETRFPQPDADGRTMVLIGQRSVCCPNGDLWQDKKPHTTRGEKSHWWVPRYECGKCEFYRKRERGGGPSFSRCAWKATVSSAQEATLQGIGKAAEAMKEAHNFANKIIGGNAQ